MTNYKTGLVLEGGGMRGLYTIGVLDYFIGTDGSQGGLCYRRICRRL